MKEIQREIIEIVRGFMMFVGKVTDITEHNSLKIFFTASGPHKYREFSLGDKKIFELGIKRGDIVAITTRGMLILENDQEIKEALCAKKEIDIKDKDWEKHIDDCLKKLKEAK